MHSLEFQSCLDRKSDLLGRETNVVQRCGHHPTRVLLPLHCPGPLILGSVVHFQCSTRAEGQGAERASRDAGKLLGRPAHGGWAKGGVRQGLTPVGPEGNGKQNPTRVGDYAVSRSGGGSSERLDQNLAAHCRALVYFVGWENIYKSTPTRVGGLGWTSQRCDVRMYSMYKELISYCS